MCVSLKIIMKETRGKRYMKCFDSQKSETAKKSTLLSRLRNRITVTTTTVFVNIKLCTLIDWLFVGKRLKLNSKNSAAKIQAF